MSADTKIEWATKTWSPMIGCTRVSAGCDNCYAIRTARVRAGNPNPKVALPFAGTVDRVDGRLDWTGQVNLPPDRLSDPLRWRKPQRIFVNSQSDLFHEQVPDEFIGSVFEVMAKAPRHHPRPAGSRHRQGHLRRLPCDRAVPHVGAGHRVERRHRGWTRRARTRRAPRPTTSGGVVKVARCGTDAGYYRHHRTLHEPACEACMDAHAAAARRRTGGKTRQRAVCGTDAGYCRHLRRAQVPCGPCTGAHAAAERRRAQARKDRAA